MCQHSQVIKLLSGAALEHHVRGGLISLFSPIGFGDDDLADTAEGFYVRVQPICAIQYF